MRKILILFIALFSVVTAVSASKKSIYNGARFFTWVNYSPDKDWNAYFKELKDVGIQGILINSGVEGYKKVIEIAKNYEIEVHAWVWVINNGGIAKENPQWLDYNAKGESLKDVKAYVEYYKFLNPAIPQAREAIAKHIEQIAQIDGIKSISFDYCRYVDAILPTSLWSKYDIVQDKVYPEWDYGYHPEMIRQFVEKYGYDPSKLDDPTKDDKWLDFRCEVLNSFVDSLAGVVRSQGKLVTASPFPTPKMSKRMVRQDWGKWNLDIAFPMIYHGFYYGDLNWIADCVKDCRKDMNKNAQLIYGFMGWDFGKKGQVEITEALETAFKNGATGFSVFTFDGLSKEMKLKLKEFIKSKSK